MQTVVETPSYLRAAEAIFTDRERADIVAIVAADPECGDLRKVQRQTMSAMFENLMTGLDEVDAFLAGEKPGYKVSVPSEVDVKAVRKRLNMTQARFSDTFGFSLDAVKHWEGGRRIPESSARAFLTVIAKNPNAVIEALHSERVAASSAERSSSSPGKIKRAERSRAKARATLHSRIGIR
jgi:putative transcriptional regulator